jgi:hypothetical protein
MARFLVEYTFSGRGSQSIESESQDAAQAIVDEQLDDEGFEPPADQYDEIEARVSEMHPVTRDGREIWANYIRPSDTRGHASAIKTSPLFAGSV